MIEVSIVIPVYNRAAVVPVTLQSILAQTYRPLQVVLVDNFSTDNTLNVLQQFKEDHEREDLLSPEKNTELPARPATTALNTPQASGCCSLTATTSWNRIWCPVT